MESCSSTAEVWSFHLDDFSTGNIMNKVEEKEGEVLSYPVANVLCLCR